MKIRTGFVSNSSSSSFILVFDKEPTIDELTKMMFNEDVDLDKAITEQYCEDYIPKACVDKVYNDIIKDKNKYNNKQNQKNHRLVSEFFSVISDIIYDKLDDIKHKQEYPYENSLLKYFDKNKINEAVKYNEKINEKEDYIQNALNEMYRILRFNYGEKITTIPIITYRMTYKEYKDIIKMISNIKKNNKYLILYKDIKYLKELINYIINNVIINQEIFYDHILNTIKLNYKRTRLIDKKYNLLDNKYNMLALVGLKNFLDQNKDKFMSYVSYEDNIDPRLESGELFEKFNHHRISHH